MKITEPTFKVFGDHSLLLEFPQEIDEKVNRQVMIWRQSILKANIEAVMHTIPAYCSLTIHFDPGLVSHIELKEIILQLHQDEGNFVDNNMTKIKIPVCYDHSFGLDLIHVSKVANLSVEEVIDLHTTKIFN